MNENEELRARIAELEHQLAKANKVTASLKERVKRSVQSAGSSYALFENNILLREAVQRQTRDLEFAKDAAEASARVKGEFLANMSHEVRTPLNGIMGTASLLLETDLDAEQREFAEIVLGSSRALFSVINDILDFSKIEAGKVELETADFDLFVVFRDIESLLRNQLESEELAFHVEIDKDLVPVRRGDPYRLRQVVINLVTNAFKFTKRGAVSLRLLRTPGDLGLDSVRVEVQDTGIGISAEDCKRLFESFAQADTSTTREYGGTGLGLSISQQLVGLMGGEIEVESVVGRGSIFRFDLALPHGSLPERSLKNRRFDKPSLDLDVLVVDDNQVNRVVAGALLKKWGCSVSTAVDGEEALSAIESGDFDAVLMDCQMPVLDGCAATRELRKRESGTERHLPVVAMTASAMERDRARCQAAGMDEYASKPIEADLLYEILSRLAANA